MTASKPKAEKFPRKGVRCEGKTDDETARNITRLVTSPEFAACRVINVSEKKSDFGEQIDVPTLLEQLRDQAAAANRGELSQAEAMLMNQATALQSLFSRLTERATVQNRMPHFEAFMRMALRAQNQSRMTLETLAYIKNPPTAFIRQQNVAVNQQVNNRDTADCTRAEVSKSGNELLNEGSHAALDNKRASTTGGVDSHLETVEACHRRNDAGR